MKKKLLEISFGKPVAAETFPDIEERDHMDISAKHKPRYLYDIREKSEEMLGEIREQFDVVFCPHILEQTPRVKLFTTIDNIAAAVKPGGELWLVTHDLEWVAREMLEDYPVSVAWPLLFGSDEFPHVNGFKMVHLRKMIERIDFIPRQAYRQQNVMKIEGSNETVKFLKLVMIAAKGIEEGTEE